MASAPNKLRIGRDAASDLVLTDKSVSRKHADLFVDSSGGLEVLDLESSSGTFLIRGGREESIARAKLRQTDRIRFGEVEFSYAELVEHVQKLQTKDVTVKPEAKPPSLPVAESSAKRSGPPPLPKSPTKSGGRMVRCECGTIKKKGSACPSCGTP
jgi:pSer/pThr/pTyr-binding forkhead associated (FHA) protein